MSPIAFCECGIVSASADIRTLGSLASQDTYGYQTHPTAAAHLHVVPYLDRNVKLALWPLKQLVENVNYIHLVNKKGNFYSVQLLCHLPAHLPIIMDMDTLYIETDIRI